jgi:hypothetical protein
MGYSRILQKKWALEVSKPHLYTDLASNVFDKLSAVMKVSIVTVVVKN